ncbi:MAG TPA: hypothetical protein VEQ42_02565, partial [Pyrinomonadaceae bacterium]|nr:hypothetical protein [Pyrinomonadaceae bacterium]
VYPPLSADVQPGDPFTPLMRANEDDKVMIKILVGAHEEGHNFTVNGIKWLFEPPVTVNRLNNTGWRNSQMMGISEHFEFVVPVLPLSQESPGPFTRSFYDFRYAPGMAVDDQWNGMWGILRAYRGAEPTSGDVIVTQPEMSATQAAALSNVSEADGTVVTTPATLLALPSNPDGRAGTASTSDPSALASDSVFPGTSTVPVCPADAGTPPPFDVTAMLARDLLPQQTLVYNPRTNVGGRLEDPTAIIYVRTSDIDPATGRLFANRNVEPLILRARAGDCITLTLRNQIPAAIDQPGFNTMPMIIDNFNANQVMPSSHVGLHPQLLYYDVSRSDGMNVGFNFVQTAAPGASVTYKWYAGDVRRSPLNPNQFFHVPVEFGATNLMPADPIKHSNKGAVGALIIEPQGATINENLTNSEGKITRAVALITPSGGPAFREFVMLFQDDINMRFGSRVSPYGWLQPVPNLAGEDDPEDTAQKAINYRTEPLWKRMGFEPDTDFEITRTFDFTNSLSNIQVGGDPVTPVFTASRGEYVRFRVVQGGGHARNHVFQINGHNWQEEPYVNDSNNIGDNPLSEVRGTQHGVGPSSHFDIDLRIGAGGRFLIRGDFLYRDRASFTFDGGMWGIFRVQ